VAIVERHPSGARVHMTRELASGHLAPGRKQEVGEAPVGAVASGGAVGGVLRAPGGIGDVVSSQTQRQPAFKDGRPIGGTGRGNKFLPNTTEWLGRFRLAANESNDWGMDREAQSSNAIYSGIDGVHLQDQAITESMGPVTDHTFEHLAPSDQMITRTRRRLLMAARALRDNNVLPPGVEDSEVFRGGRSGYFVSDDKSPWRELYARQLSVAVHPSPIPLRAAE
jgi:hypothetical protein